MLMHCSEQRGRLVLAGKPMPNAALSRLLGLSQQETQDALAAILDSGVASKDEAGVIYCRRMVREEELLQKRKEAGSKGGSKRQANREQTPDNDNGTDNGLDRVREFARERGISESDADWFYWKGKGNGWTNRGEPIRDWKATLLCWFRAGYLPSQKQSRNGSSEYSQMTKYNLPLPKGCTIRKDGEVLDYTGRIMDINQVRKANQSYAA